MRRNARALLLVAALAGTAVAQEAEAPADELPPHKVGPVLVDVGDGVEVELPAGMILIERDTARKLMEQAGESSEGVMAMIWPEVPDDADVPWTVFLIHNDIGYVSDADADQLDAGELLESYKQGTAEQNKIRVAAGGTELFVDGWARPPSYDRTRRVLSWAVDGHDRDYRILNDFTNVLGRRGYVAINLVSSPDEMEASRAAVAVLMAGIRYKPGHRYEDFDPSVDKSSGIGLRELVVGGGVIAAVKAGKLGLFAKLLIAFKKFFIIIGLAIAGFFKWLHARVTGRRSEPA